MNVCRNEHMMVLSFSYKLIEYQPLHSDLTGSLSGFFFCRFQLCSDRGVLVVLVLDHAVAYTDRELMSKRGGSTVRLIIISEEEDESPDFSCLCGAFQHLSWDCGGKLLVIVWIHFSWMWNFMYSFTFHVCYIDTWWLEAGLSVAHTKSKSFIRIRINSKSKYRFIIERQVSVNQSING